MSAFWGAFVGSFVGLIAIFVIAAVLGGDGRR